MSPSTSSSRPVVIAGGGTGGHTSPGLAVASVLRSAGVECIWIGSTGGIEARRAPEHGIPYHAIPTGKLRRYWARENITDLALNVPAGMVAAFRLLRRLQPGVVFGTGGFVAVPVVIAAAAARVPIVIHEQTAAAGLANRIAARFARKIAVSWEDGSSVFPAEKVVLTGNPLRPELRSGSRADAVARFGLDPSVPILYVTGGAQGSMRINRAVGEALPVLLEHTQIIHQCGSNAATNDRRWLEDRRARLPAELVRRYTVMPFVGAELGDVYAAASLVVARAGAGTVNECCQLGVPAIYIPLPSASRDEQTANARLVERAGGCVMVRQSALKPERLLERIRQLLGDPAALKAMGDRARALAIPDADERLAGVILDVRG